MVLAAILLLFQAAGHNPSPASIAEFGRVSGYLQKWKVRLGLRDMPIALKLVTRQEMDLWMDDACGYSIYHDLGKPSVYGTILVLRSDQYPQEGKPGVCGTSVLDQEDTVVHELLHYVVEVGTEEQKVDMLARNLVPVEEVK